MRGEKALICQGTLWLLFPLNVCIEINVALLLQNPITAILTVVFASALCLGGNWEMGPKGEIRVCIKIVKVLIPQI